MWAAGRITPGSTHLPVGRAASPPHGGAAGTTDPSRVARPMEFPLHELTSGARAQPGLAHPGTFLAPLIGSRREHAHLQQMISDARAGRAGVAGIHGLPGSGKSFLLDAMVAQATEFTVIRLPVRANAPSELDPWREVFRLAGDEAGGDSSAPTPLPPSLDDLHRSVVSAIDATCTNAGAPALLVFDDCTPAQAHVVEAISGAVLDPALDVPVVFVLAWRDNMDGSTPPFQQSTFPVHKLQPFTQEQATDFLAVRIGRLPEPSVLAEIWRFAGGNPSGILFACSQLSDEELDGLVPLPDPLPIGSDLAEAFGRWADGLETDARLAVTVASTSSMPRPILEDALAGIELTIEALRPAIVSGAVAIRGDRVEFVHPLCRAAVFQRSSAHSQLAARQAVAHAYRRAGLPEAAALQAVLSTPARDDDVAMLCMQASQAASQRSDHDVAARFEVLGARFAQTERLAAQHLIRASSLWQAAGRLERANESLRHISPVNLSTAVMGKMTYRAACIAFSAEASPQAPADMASGAETTAMDEPGEAVAMMADAAAERGVHRPVGRRPRVRATGDRPRRERARCHPAAGTGHPGRGGHARLRRGHAGRVRRPGEVGQPDERVVGPGDPAARLRARQLTGPGRDAGADRSLADLDEQPDRDVGQPGAARRCGHGQDQLSDLPGPCRRGRRGRTVGGLGARCGS